MAVQSVRIPDELVAELDEMSRASKRSKSSFIVEAIQLYVEERKDLEIALARFRDPGTEWVDHAEVRRALDID